MNFESSEKEIFEIDGNTFNFNHERTEYLANDIHKQYEKRIKKIGKQIKSSKKKEQREASRDILAIYNEWNVSDNDETLYLVFSEDDNETFTDVLTENEYYPNPIK